jgi:hypothetical protein
MQQMTNESASTSVNSPRPLFYGDCVFSVDAILNNECSTLFLIMLRKYMLVITKKIWDLFYLLAAGYLLDLGNKI